MIVEQALFGEVKGGGHGLRLASGDVEVVRELAPRLDLPDNAPAGADWSPYVSGFPYRDRYVLARTFRDPNATRGDIVLAHALVCMLDDVIGATDLRSLFAQLMTEPVVPESLSAIEIVRGDEMPPAPIGIHAVAMAIVARGQTPAVCAGSVGIEDTICALWARLWPAVRRSFAFRLSFGPGDIVETPPPVVVCTPTSLIARWPSDRLVESFHGSAISMAASALIDAQDGKPLLDFAAEIGAPLSSIGELSLLDQAHRMVRRSPDDIRNTVAAIRLVELLSPDPSRGCSRKAALVTQLALQLENCSSADILTLRNVALAGFDGSSCVWRAMTERVANDQYSPADDANKIGLVADALNDGRASENWRTAVGEGLLGTKEQSWPALSRAIWRWMGADDSLPVQLLAWLRSTPSFEDRVLNGAPTSMSIAHMKPVLDYAVSERLYRLYAVSLASSLVLQDAIRHQLLVEPEDSSSGLSLILDRASPEETIRTALEFEDRRLMPFASRVVESKPQLLADQDMSNVTMRQIWSDALGVNAKAWQGPKEPRAEFEKLLNELIDGGDPYTTLIERLARTPLGDLQSFERRSELWSKLVGPSRGAMIDATAAGWLDAISQGRIPFVPDAVLLEAISRSAKLVGILNALATNITHAVAVFSTVASLGEQHFRKWLSGALERSRHIGTSEADAIGRLVEIRRWSGAASDLVSFLRRGRDDVKPALRACVSLVGILDRWLLNLSAVSSSEKWELLANLAAELYPHGPDQDDLWERAGGKSADINGAGTGRHKWSEALRQVRLGRLPRIDKLLGEMTRDYGQNQHLRSLANDSEFRN